MGSEWLKNMCGVTLSDEQMKNIPHSTTELGIHVTIKNMQAFGLLGTVLVGPITAAIKAETRNWVGIQHRMLRAGRGGLILGLATGFPMTLMMMRNQEEERIYDRCYRLRYNRGQVRVDQTSVIGAAAGAGVAMATGSTPLFGVLVGMSSGILLAAFYNNVIVKS